MSGAAELRKVTIVVEGGDLGAALARAIGVEEGLAPMGYATRREGVMVYGLSTARDARSRWVRACKAAGLKVVPAPWEKKRGTDKADA